MLIGIRYRIDKNKVRLCHFYDSGVVKLTRYKVKSVICILFFNPKLRILAISYFVENITQCNRI